MAIIGRLLHSPQGASSIWMLQLQAEMLVSQKRKQIAIVAMAAAILVGVLIWAQAGIADPSVRRQVTLVSAVLGIPIIVILIIRGLITVVMDDVKANAPEVYASVKGLGQALSIAVMMSSGLVFSLSILLRNPHDPLYLECFGVIATALLGGVATYCWRYVWKACRVLSAYRQIRNSRRSRL